MQTSQIIACDITKQSLGLAIAVKYSYPATTSGEVITRTLIVSIPTIELLTALFMKLDTEPLKNGRLATTAMRIQKAMSCISAANRGTRPISIIALSAIAWGFHNYYQEHGYLPAPVPILPRANAKLKKGEDRAPTRDQLLKAYDLEDFKKPKHPSKKVTRAIQDGIGTYGEEQNIPKITMEDWLSVSSSSTGKSIEELEAEKEAKELKELEAMDKILSNL